MTISLIGANIVLLAKNHNPSIVSKDWLSQKGILTESVKSFTHTPAFSVIETEYYSFIIDPDRLQLSVRTDFENNASVLEKKILAYVQALPETPYHAIGFNFIYKVESEKSILHKIYCSDDVLESLFSEDYQLGGMIKFNFNKFVVKLILQPANGGEMIADFNYHHQLEEDDNIEQCITIHSEAIMESTRILRRLIDE